MGQMATKRTKSGFSLIEILVATAILVILILIMSMIFHQSTVAWDGGTRKAEGNLTARAILAFMAREMSEAVVDPDVFGMSTYIQNDDSQITFVTLRGAPSSTLRTARRITYSLTGGKIQRREEAARKGGGIYGMSWQNLTSADLGDRVSFLNFATSDTTNHTETLPASINITMGVTRSADVSGVGAWSFGADRVDGTEDDIRSQ